MAQSGQVQSTLRSVVQSSQNFTQQARSTQDGVPDPTLVDNLKILIRAISDESNSKISPVQISSLLTALSVSGLDRHEQVISTFVDEILSHWSLGRGLVDQRTDSSDQRPICDIVGTGGDGFNTFNVSTTAAIVAAGAGVKICKHGNRASSSVSGSADLLMALGIPLAQLNPEQVTSLIQKPDMDFSFIFAPTFYPIFGRLSPIRKDLGFPTIFNRLGPLLNPSRPDRLIIGITNPQLGPIYCQVLRLAGLNQSWVVCSDEGLDEISTAGPTSLWKLDSNGSTVHEKVDPVSTFGLPIHPVDQLTCQNPQQNLNTLNDLLDRVDQLKSESDIAKLDFVLMNTSALLVLAGLAQDFKHGVELARESLRSGKAKAVLYRFRDHAQALAS